MRGKAAFGEPVIPPGRWQTQALVGCTTPAFDFAFAIEQDYQAAGSHLPPTPGGRTGFAISPGLQDGKDWPQACARMAVAPSK